MMGTFAALVKVDESRENLQQGPSNYFVNKKKSYLYTANEAHVAVIQQALPSHKVIYIGGDIGFTLSGIPLGGEQYIRAALQNNLNKTTHIIANISRLTNVQEKLILLLQCIPGRIQHLLAAVPTHLSRDFARQHDEAIMNAVADALELRVSHGEGQDADATQNLQPRTRPSQHGIEPRVSLSCRIHENGKIHKTCLP